MLFRRRRAAPAQTLELSGTWTDGVWDGSPVRVPAMLDVDEFLGQRPVPAIYPDDPGFLAYADSDEKMRRLWVYVLLHHPEPDVVVTVLRSHLEEAPGHVIELADMMLDGRSVHEAAAALWRMSDDAVHTALNVVLDRGVAPGWHSPAQSRRALALLRETCPAERRGFLEADIAG